MRWAFFDSCVNPLRDNNMHYATTEQKEFRAALKTTTPDFAARTLNEMGIFLFVCKPTKG